MENLKLSTDIKKILSSASNIAIGEKLKEVPVELVIREIIRSAAKDEIQDCNLRDYLRDMSSLSDSMEYARLIDEIDVLLVDSVYVETKFDLSGNLRSKDSLPLDSYLLDIFEKASFDQNSENSNCPPVLTTFGLIEYLGSLHNSTHIAMILEEFEILPMNHSGYSIQDMSSTSKKRREIGKSRTNNSVLKEKIMRGEIDSITDSDISQLLEEMSEAAGFLDSMSDGGSKKGNDDDDSKLDFEKAGEKTAISSKYVDPNSKTPFLDEFAFDMTAAAEEGKFDPMIGREKELEQMIEVLCCRKKNNAILLGDPGCGKTALVEGLVQRIKDKLVPVEIQNKRICSLDLNALVSGTKFRGEYEERLQGIIKEVCDNPRIIVYIDEFHNLVGNGNSSGGGDGANILKPYLARGEFQCIGSTTIDEYRKIVEKDGALKRRFQSIMIDEPTEKETVDILTSLSKQYSEFHKVKYSKEVLEKCVDWSGRYVIDRYFPDKAIDIMDTVGSYVKLKSPKQITKVQELELEISELETKLKESVTKEHDFEQGIKYRDEKNRKVKELEAEMKKKKKESTKDWPEITVEDVAAVVSKLTSVPVDKIDSSDSKKLSEMMKKLDSKVIGQAEATQKVAISLQRNSLGLRDENKPIATFLMVGPTGTGKTLICKEIAKEFFGSDKNLIRFDMSEFGERHEVTKLTGATASYVGYNDSPLLDQVRRKPYSVVLFDEIEKAAPEIYNLFLNILDEGFITLGNGVKVDFRNTIIIFTGNVGTKELVLRGDGLGFSKGVSREDRKSDINDTVMKAVKKEFKPEFINRLSEIVIFNSLEKEELLKIFEIEYKKLEERIKKKGYKVTVSLDVKEFIVSKCDTNYGARDLQRYIVRNIEDNICLAMLEKEFKPGGTIVVKFDKKENKVVVDYKEKTVRKTSTEKTSVSKKSKIQA